MSIMNTSALIITAKREGFAEAAAIIEREIKRIDRLANKAHDKDEDYDEYERLDELTRPLWVVLDKVRRKAGIGKRSRS